VQYVFHMTCRHLSQWLAVSIVVATLACGESPIGAKPTVVIRPPAAFPSPFMINDSAQLTAFDGGGNPLPPSSVTWHSSNPAVLSVSGGLAVGLARGTSRVDVTSGSVTGSLTVSVQGTRHSSPITTDQTWSLATAPHGVKGRLLVSGTLGGPKVTLTIEPGVTVIFLNSAGLTFGGSGAGGLAAIGSAAAPITLRGSDSTGTPGKWVGLTFRSADTSRMLHVILTGCGGVRTDSLPSGCVVGMPSPGGSGQALLIDTVIVQSAAVSAVTLGRGAHFAAGSSTLSVQGTRGHIAAVPAGIAAEFPVGGTFFGNDTEFVQITGDTVRTSGTWSAAVPWEVLDPVLIEGPATPVLKIPAGTTMAMIGGFVVGKNAAGGLQIGDTAGSPVMLQPIGASLWAGIDFSANAVNSFIANATLKNPGAYNPTRAGSGGLSIAGNYNGGPTPAPVLRNVTIEGAYEWGVGLSNGGTFGVGSANITITGTTQDMNSFTGTPLVVYQSSPGSIPAGHYTGNGWDVIQVLDVTVRQDQDWHQHDVPYLLRGNVTIGDSLANPVLTLDSGVVLELMNNGLSVGASAPGAIHAVGTATAPITFRGVSDVPVPGSWGGIQVWYQADSSTVFNHVIVDAGGAPQPVAGEFVFYVDLGPIIKNAMISHSAGCGIMISGTPFSTDFTAPALGNSFVSDTLGAQCGP